MAAEDPMLSKVLFMDCDHIPSDPAVKLSHKQPGVEDVETKPKAYNLDYNSLD